MEIDSYIAAGEEAVCVILEIHAWTRGFIVILSFYIWKGDKANAKY